jgi:uncharacterized membrane protein
MDKNINRLLNQEDEQLKKLKQIVNDSMQAEQLIIDNLLNPPLETLSRGQRISDKVARFGGSWKFIITFLLVMLLWISFNIIALIQYRFDPFPFILLNLVLSCVAALQAPIIMMSQNRQEEKDRMRSENDYLVNLKAELEIRSLHRKMDLLLEEQIKTLFETQATQFKALEEIKRILLEMKKGN